jgi:hypothetical protein
LETLVLVLRSYIFELPNLLLKVGFLLGFTMAKSAGAHSSKAWRRRVMMVSKSISNIGLVMMHHMRNLDT